MKLFAILSVILVASISIPSNIAFGASDEHLLCLKKGSGEVQVKCQKKSGIVEGCSIGEPFEIKNFFDSLGITPGKILSDVENEYSTRSECTNIVRDLKDLVGEDVRVSGQTGDLTFETIRKSPKKCNDICRGGRPSIHSGTQTQQAGVGTGSCSKFSARVDVRPSLGEDTAASLQVIDQEIGIGPEYGCAKDEKCICQQTRITVVNADTDISRGDQGAYGFSSPVLGDEFDVLSFEIIPDEANIHDQVKRFPKNDIECTRNEFISEISLSAETSSTIFTTDDTITVNGKVERFTDKCRGTGLQCRAQRFAAGQQGTSCIFKKSGIFGETICTEYGSCGRRGKVFDEGGRGCETNEMKLIGGVVTVIGIGFTIAGAGAAAGIWGSAAGAKDLLLVGGSLTGGGGGIATLSPDELPKAAQTGDLLADTPGLPSETTTAALVGLRDSNIITGAAITPGFSVGDPESTHKYCDENTIGKESNAEKYLVQTQLGFQYDQNKYCNSKYRGLELRCVQSEGKERCMFKEGFCHKDEDCKSNEYCPDPQVAHKCEVGSRETDAGSKSTTNKAEVESKQGELGAECDKSRPCKGQLKCTNNKCVLPEIDTDSGKESTSSQKGKSGSIPTQPKAGDRIKCDLESIKNTPYANNPSGYCLSKNPGTYCDTSIFGDYCRFREGFCSDNRNCGYEKICVEGKCITPISPDQCRNEYRWDHESKTCVPRDTSGQLIGAGNGFIQAGALIMGLSRAADSKPDIEGCYRICSQDTKKPGTKIAASPSCARGYPIWEMEGWYDCPKQSCGGFSGRTVNIEIQGAGGRPVKATATTDADGFFTHTFKKLPEGAYTVKLTTASPDEIKSEIDIGERVRAGAESCTDKRCSHSEILERKCRAQNEDCYGISLERV